MYRGRLPLLFIITLLVSLASFSSHATERWSVLVVPEYDNETLAADHKAYRKVRRTIAEALTSHFDLDVYDGAARGINLRCKDKCNSSMYEKSLTTIREANETSNKDHIDLVIFYQISMSERKTASTTKHLVRVSLQALDLESGKNVVYTDGDEQLPQIMDKGLDEVGIHNWQADQASRNARVEAEYIGERLKNFERIIEYRIDLNDFTQGELSRFEKTVRKHKSYQSGQFELSGSGESVHQWLHTLKKQSYRFKTSMGGGQLKQYMQDFFDEAGVPQILNYEQPTRLFRLHRLGLAYLVWYVLAIVAVICLLLFMFAGRYYRMHYRQLAIYAHDKNISSGLSYLKERRTSILPQTKQWKAWREKWLLAEKEAFESLKQAKVCIENHDYDAAMSHAENAMTKNSDLDEANELITLIPDYKKGYELFISGESLVSEAPSEAAKKLVEAELLNPAMAEQIATLLQIAKRNLRQGVFKTKLAAASQALENQKPYIALSNIDAALYAIEGLDDFSQDLDQLSSMRTLALTLINPVTSNASFNGAMGGVTLFGKSSVTIGRPSSSAEADIQINFKRMSRPGKQTQITRQGHAYIVQDMNSTHGTMVDGQLLESGSSFAVNKKVTVSMGGSKSPASSGPCRFILEPDAADGKSLIIRFDYQSLALLDQTQLGSAWPTLEADVQRKWALVGEFVGVGIQSGQLDLGCQTGTEPVFLLRFNKALGKDSLEISPVNKGTADGLSINGAEVVDYVPVQAGVEIKVKQHTFTVLANHQ